MESFPAYVRLVRKRGPQPFWTPVAPVHRIFSYALSYVYVLMRLTPFAVTLWGLAIGITGFLLLGLGETPTLWWLGLALVNLGVIHDACDGEVARYRIHHGMQSIKTYRVGIIGDFWAFAILIQAGWPIALGWIVWQAGGNGWFVAAGVASALILLSSYVLGYGKGTYWPDPTLRVLNDSFSFATDAGGFVKFLGRAYFWVFETAMFTTHASVVLGAWQIVGGNPWWLQAYAAFVIAGIGTAFLLSHFLTVRSFDEEGAKQ